MGPSAGVPARVALFHGWADSPVWFRTPGHFGPVDLATLPISRSLHERLLAWNEFADEILSANDYAWPSPDVESAFMATGAELAAELRRELGIEVVHPHDGPGGTADDTPAGPSGPGEDEAR